MKRDEFLRQSQLIAVTRDIEYGSPNVSMLRISRLWSEFLGYPIDPHEVAVCMLLLKVSRISEQAQIKDHYLDIINYTTIAGELATMDWDDLDAG
jgi:hypothetical protein